MNTPVGCLAPSNGGAAYPSRLARWPAWLGACVLWLPLSWASASEFVGLVRPTADVQVSVPVAGVVERVLVKPGQWVREGQPLL